MAATFARWTTDPAGDLARTWCWQPCDAAIDLPSGPLADDALDAAIDVLADDQPAAARTLRDCRERLAWTGANWATVEDGIPGIEIEDDLSDEDILDTMPATGNVSTGGDAVLALYAGEWAGEEYEAAITDGRACRFQPTALLRIVG